MDWKKSLCIIALCIMCATGCGDTKKLECSIENNYNDETKMKQDVKVTFINDKMTKLVIDLNVELAEDYLEYKESLAEAVTGEFLIYKDENGFDYSTSTDDIGFKFKLKVNFDDVSDEVKSNFDFVNSFKGYDKIKDDFESEGYSCK